MNPRFQQVTATGILLAVIGLSALLLRSASVHPRTRRQPPAETSPARRTGTQLEDFGLPKTGNVVRVVDGDTIDVEVDGRVSRVRVYGIDCPEEGQPFADEAKEFVASLIEGKTVSLTPIESDRLGRSVADVSTSKDGKAYHLSEMLLSVGLAWWYEGESPQDRHLELLEARARETRRGLWADPDPVPPWEYRRLKGKPLPQETAP